MKLIAPFAMTVGLAAGPALAQDSVTYASRAAKDSVSAAANLTAAGVSAVGGVVALPLGLAGGASMAVGGSAQAAGSVASEVGADLVEGADQLLNDSWGPLKVDDKVIVTPDPAPQLDRKTERGG